MSRDLQRRFKEFRRENLQEEINLGLEPLPSVVYPKFIAIFEDLTFIPKFRKIYTVSIMIHKIKLQQRAGSLAI